MSSCDVRRGVTRAGWNKSHSDWYSVHFVMLCVLIGVLFTSWWVFLVALFIVSALEATSIGGRLMLWVYMIPWAVILGAIGAAIGGIPAACVFAIIGGGIVYVTLESGRQYLHDL
jgi:hypothetical protein